jgi:hypothetical protein
LLIPSDGCQSIRKHFARRTRVAIPSLKARRVKDVRALLRSGDVLVSTIAEQFRVARSTLVKQSNSVTG